MQMHMLRSFLYKQMKGALKCTDVLKQGQFVKAADVLSEHLGDVCVYFLSPKGKVVGKAECSSNIKINICADLTIEISGTRKEEKKNKTSKKSDETVALALAAKRANDKKDLACTSHMPDSSDDLLKKEGEVEDASSDEDAPKLFKLGKRKHAHPPTSKKTCKVTKSELLQDVHLSDTSSSEDEGNIPSTSKGGLLDEAASESGDEDLLESKFQKSLSEAQGLLSNQVGDVADCTEINEIEQKSNAVIDVLEKVFKCAEEFCALVENRSDSLSSAAKKRGEILQQIEREIAASSRRKNRVVRQLKNEEEEIQSVLVAVQKLKKDVLAPLTSCNNCTEHCFSSIKDHIKGFKGPKPSKKS